MPVSATDVLSLRRLNIIFSFVLVLFTLLLLLTVLSLRRVQRDIKVDDELLARSLQTATIVFLREVSGISNHVESVDSSPGASLSSVSHRQIPFCIYSSPRYGLTAVFGGSKYHVGDYCDEGLIVSILDDRVYVRDTDGNTVVLRPSSQSAVSAAPLQSGAADQAAPEGEGGAMRFF